LEAEQTLKESRPPLQLIYPDPPCLTCHSRGVRILELLTSPVTGLTCSVARPQPLRDNHPPSGVEKDNLALRVLQMLVHPHASPCAPRSAAGADRCRRGSGRSKAYKSAHLVLPAAQNMEDRYPALITAHDLTIRRERTLRWFTASTISGKRDCG